MTVSDENLDPKSVGAERIVERKLLFHAQDEVPHTREDLARGATGLASGSPPTLSPQMLSPKVRMNPHKVMDKVNLAVGKMDVDEIIKILEKVRFKVSITQVGIIDVNWESD